MFQASHLTARDIAKIAKLSEGIFDDTVLIIHTIVSIIHIIWIV